jgi:hypothetical protein
MKQYNEKSQVCQCPRCRYERTGRMYEQELMWSAGYTDREMRAELEGPDEEIWADPEWYAEETPLRPETEEGPGEWQPNRIIWRGGLRETGLWHRHQCDCGRETDCRASDCYWPTWVNCPDCELAKAG